MATTPNFGWVTPAPTDFVTDLPADFETFADAVDADVQLIKNTADAALPETLIDAAGDLIYGSAADTAARLAIGTAGQVLKVNSGATAPEWGTATAAENYTLLNTGGTALTGAQTVTVSGISGIGSLYIFIYQASSANASSEIRVRLNGDTGNNYSYYGWKSNIASTYSALNTESDSSNATSRIIIGKMANAAGSWVDGYCIIKGCNSSGVKTFIAGGGGIGSGGTGHEIWNTSGAYSGSSTISSVSIMSSTGNLDNGTVYIYGSA